MGWRWSFIIAGIPGIILGLVLLATVKEPVRSQPKADKAVKARPTVISTSNKEKIKQMVKFLRPSILLLWVASSIRNAAGYVWAYNTQLYFDGMGQTPTEIGSYMSWIPIVGGSFGVVFGGFISDRVVQRTGPHGRIWVLAASQILSAPFAAGVLFLDPPYCYYSLLPNYIIGEMWVGVTLAVLVELVAPDVKVDLSLSIIALHVLFSLIIWYIFRFRRRPWRPTSLSSRMSAVICLSWYHPSRKPLLTRGLEKRMLFEVSLIELNPQYPLSDYVPDFLLDTLYLLFPGEYVLGAILFLVTLFVLKHDIQYIRQQQQVEQGRINTAAATSQYGTTSTITEEN